MTRTQLQQMSDRDLIEHAFRASDQINLGVRHRNDLIQELACRLDDTYPFDPDLEPETETTA